MTKKKGKIIKNVILIVVVYALITILLKGGMLNRQYRSLLVPIGVNIMLAVSLNLVTGFLGELSLGHACFMSIGAYTSSLTSIYFVHSLPAPLGFAISLLVGGIVAAVFGLLIGIPVLRLNGDYLAIVTLAFGEIVKSVINVIGITGGAKGLSKIPLRSDYNNYTLVFILTVLTIVFIVNFVHSRDGRAITAIRDNEIATESIGIAAFFAGVAGCVYAHNVGIIKPQTFDYNKSIEILVIVVLGGMGSVTGSVIAAIVLTILPEFLRGADNLRMLLYAVVLILIMIFNHSKIKEGLLNNKTTRKLLGKGEA